MLIQSLVDRKEGTKSGLSLARWIHFDALANQKQNRLSSIGRSLWVHYSLSGVKKESALQFSSQMGHEEDFGARIHASTSLKRVEIDRRCEL